MRLLVEGVGLAPLGVLGWRGCRNSLGIEGLRNNVECRCQDSVRHHNVTVQQGRYTFGLASFDNIQQFLEHFDKQPIVAGESGKKMIVVFVSPYISSLLCF